MLFLGLPDLRGSWSISEHDVFVYRQNFTRDPHMSSTCRPETSLLVFWIPPPAAPGDFPHRSICMAKPPLSGEEESYQGQQGFILVLQWFCCSDFHEWLRAPDARSVFNSNERLRSHPAWATWFPGGDPCARSSYFKGGCHLVFAKIVERRPQNSSRVCPGLDGIAGRLRAGVWPISKLAAEAACHPGQGPRNGLWTASRGQCP